MKKRLTKILWGRQNPWRFVFAGLGFLLGLSILLISLHLYLDIQQLLDARARRSADYLILNKDISIANTFGLASSAFSEPEIEGLRKQPFVKQLGRFTASQFSATIETSQTLPFYTQLFFESVPDGFLDNIPGEWHWNESSTRLPIIVSQDFLNLYNFGYALGQGLPQLSEGALKLIPLRVTLQGRQGQQTFEGRIVGFSDRIASVLVPESFMRWANARFGPGGTPPSGVPPDGMPPPSRLIVQVQDASDPAIAAYLSEHDYQTNNDQLKTSRTGRTIQLVMGMIGVVGSCFIGLSLVLFITSFRMIIAEAREEITLLLQLGYRTQTLARHLLGVFALFLLLTTILALFALWIAMTYAHKLVQQQGLELTGGLNGWVVVAGVGFAGLCLLLNRFSIHRLLRRQSA